MGTFAKEASVARIEYVHSVVRVPLYHGVAVGFSVVLFVTDRLSHPVIDRKPTDHAHQYLVDTVQLFELCDNCENAESVCEAQHVEQQGCDRNSAHTHILGGK